MRRFDMDWLRVLVFGLLILYHVGMFFVPWGWHIKNNEISLDLQWPMLFVNQWRLPILFVISGMGTYYAFGKRSAGQFAKERLIRLFIPLAVGMFLIVPPQVYIERIATGQFSGGYFDFWPAHAFSGGTYPDGNLTWHHLWFLPYLLIFSLVLIPVFSYLRKNPQARFLKWTAGMYSNPWKIFLLIIPLYLAEAFLEPFFPVTHALVGDWFALAFFLVLFFYGFLLIASGGRFWEFVARYRRIYLMCGIVGFTALIGIILLYPDSTWRHFTEAGIKVFNIWSWILAIFGYGSAYLNKPSRALAYANQAVYPFYILHQTITLVVAYYLMDLNWSVTTKFVILTVVTFGGSWLIYEFLIRRWKWIRPLFGLKVRRLNVDAYNNRNKELIQDIQLSKAKQ
ncbi:acyltransferase family protein [Aureitalea marina]|uniref:Glucan biosynthesis protein n=1 Tax=Aureitalea marina TaxID=930804 RepID=A0A2S7KNA7_9FLAO|nr:acyltransferase family protein [Aureitalea marina]PQB04070.1 glucan biosynthesis protein [Aureitalea marina]